MSDKQSMIDNSLPTLLATLPLPEAISAVHHELRMPVISMRAALQIIERFCQPAAVAGPLQPLIAQVGRIYDCVDRLFDLRHLVASRHGAASPAHHHQPSLQPIALLQEIIGQLREETLALHQLAQGMQETRGISLTADAQKLFTIFQTNSDVWSVAIDDILADALARRLQDAEER
ncbi:MAG: hypothetical protein ACJ8CR_19070 [Roseiflexaceae bacterium]